MDRRNFIKKGALAGIAGTTTAAVVLNSCTGKTREYSYPPMLDKAPVGKKIRAGLVGCGSRGTGAAFDFLEADNNVELISLGDVFNDKLQSCRNLLREQKSIDIDSEKCFTGFDAFQHVIDSGIDLVILATPPHFRPEHFEAAVKAGKHVFMEKPVAVDTAGVRKVMINAERAKAKNLSVMAGTIYRHHQTYVETFKQVANGAIGEVISGNAYYNQGKLWHVNPNANWSEMEYMIRDWVNWSWLSGDHIVEQHVHNLDIMNWFIGAHPEQALGFGGRHRRPTGNQYDFFSVDFLYPNQVHVHSMSRQINGCDTNVSDYIRGTNGYTNCKNSVFNNNGELNWAFPYTEEQNENYFFARSYVQEHIDLITSIRNNLGINEAMQVAESTLTGIIGRMSAYTGKNIYWDEALNSDIKLGPKVYTFDKVHMDKSIPVPGN